MMRTSSAVTSVVGPGAFRLFLALVVFVHHATRIALGAAAVEIFFCLSGFWIYRMWTERYLRCRYPYITYVISRSWRLLPAFTLVALLTLGLQHDLLDRSWSDLRGSAGWVQFVAAHLFILGYNSLPVQPLVPAWSLDVEMQFYLVAPVLIGWATRFDAIALLFAMAAVSLAFAYRIGGGASPTFAVFFGLGIVAARKDWRPGPRLVAFTGLAVPAMIVGLAISPWRGALFGGAHPGDLFRYSDVVNTAVALLAFPYAIFTIRQRGGAHDAVCADVSYIVYLLHWIAICWLGEHAWLPMTDRIACFAVALAATLAGAWLIWSLYDRPMNKARTEWVAARVSAPHVDVATQPSVP